MRQPKPYWKSTHKCYYVKINRKEVRLDPDETKAYEIYHQVMGRQLDLSDPCVLPLLDEFLEVVQHTSAKGTYVFYQYYIKLFAKTINAGLKVHQLKPYHVTKWADKLYKNPNSKRNALRAITAAFNWAIREGFITFNPLSKIKKPSPVPRDVYLTSEQYNQFVKAIDGGFRDLVVFMRLTGCRVQEARILTAKMLDHDNKCFVIPRELSKGGKSERTILLNNEAYNIVKDKTGFVFTNTKGRPWKAKSIHSKCWHLSKTLGFPITLGTLRHVFITDALVNGVDPISLSKIVGHKDLKMIQGVYSKLEKRTDHLRKALNRAVKGV